MRYYLDNRPENQENILSDDFSLMGPLLRARIVRPQRSVHLAWFGAARRAVPDHDAEIRATSL